MNLHTKEINKSIWNKILSKSPPFPTRWNVVSGWTDEDLEKLIDRLEAFRVVEKQAKVESLLKANVCSRPKHNPDERRRDNPQSGYLMYLLL